MNAWRRIGLFGLGLVVVFAAAFATARAVAPGGERVAAGEAGGHGGHGGGSRETKPAAETLGLELAQAGYRLTGLSAPARPGENGELRFSVTGPDGQPVTEFERQHEKELHLIAVRADGQHFAHVHPERDRSGTWSIPWRFAAAGTYRFYADIKPAGQKDGLTLSTTAQVGGRFAPQVPRPSSSVTVGDFRVEVDGHLMAGRASTLTMRVTRRDGEPVTDLQPYLGAFGHLVALRDGDLAYLHVHPEGEAPRPGQLSGPEVAFSATAPTPGKYLLYFDFRIDGTVYSAPLVLETEDHG